MNIQNQSPEKLWWMLETMLVIRRVEEEINNLFARGQIFGTTHLYAGQEAVAAGACYPLRRDDYVASTHRGHGHAIAKGVDVRQLAAELLGKDEGMCRGRGGTQHLSDLNVGFLGTNGITGGFIPIATGTALSFKMKKESRVAVSFFGDGASNTGYFHESLNFASLYKLPVIFVCENNLYAMSIHVKKSTSATRISERAASYSMPGVVVDGMDPFAVESVMIEALERARSGEGPTLIEAETYRFHGHSKSDQRLYRTREEESFWRGRDPIEVLAKAMVQGSAATETDVENCRNGIFSEVREAFQWAAALPDPSSFDLLQGVFS